MPYSLASLVFASLVFAALVLVAALATLAHASGLDVEALAKSLALVLAALAALAKTVRRLAPRE